MGHVAASMTSICLAGPTASGKSALAIALAHEVGGAIVNADSMQVYADLHTLTARPDADEVKCAPHHLYGHVDAASRYSAGFYLDDVARLVTDIRDAGMTPIFVGGTGLYFKGLLEGFSPIPDVPETVLAELQDRLNAEGVAPLHAELIGCDPVLASRLPPTDGQRIVRALSVHKATGTPLSTWQAQPGRPLIQPDQTLRLFLDADRDWLAARINARFATMMESGAVEEVKQLAARQLDPTLPAMRAHGVPHLIAMLEGRLSRKDAIARGQADTRAYAKRQRTWFRGQMAGWHAIQPGTPVADILSRA
jgi:tRNA dimethylallyltransferase